MICQAATDTRDWKQSSECRMICRLRLHLHVNLTTSYSRLFGPALQQLSIVFDLWRKGYQELFGSIHINVWLCNRCWIKTRYCRSEFRHRVLLKVVKILRLVFTIFTWLVESFQLVNELKAVAGKIPRLDPTSSCRSGANTASNCWTGFNFLFQNVSSFSSIRDTKSIPKKNGSPKSLFKVRKRMWQNPWCRSESPYLRNITPAYLRSIQSSKLPLKRENTWLWQQTSRSFKVGRFDSSTSFHFNPVNSQGWERFYRRTRGAAVESRWWGGRGKWCNQVLRIISRFKVPMAACRKEIWETCESCRWQPRTRLFQTLAIQKQFCQVLLKNSCIATMRSPVIIRFQDIWHAQQSGVGTELAPMRLLQRPQTFRQSSLVCQRYPPQSQIKQGKSPTETARLFDFEVSSCDFSEDMMQDLLFVYVILRHLHSFTLSQLFKARFNFFGSQLRLNDVENEKSLEVNSGLREFL